MCITGGPKKSTQRKPVSTRHVRPVICINGISLTTSSKCHCLLTMISN